LWRYIPANDKSKVDKSFRQHNLTEGKKLSEHLKLVEDRAGTKAAPTGFAKKKPPKVAQKKSGRA
jgi:hypothetical protein